MTQEQKTFSNEDWLVIDAALNKVAKSIRKIEKREKQEGQYKKSQVNTVSTAPIE